MLKLLDRWYQPTEKQISKIFYELFYKDIYEALQYSLENRSSKTALISKIRQGKIVYRDGVFSGEFSIETSRYLSKFAVFDQRSRTWKGLPPGDVLAAATVANSKSEKLHALLKDRLDQLETRLQDTELSFNFPVPVAVDEIDSQLMKDFATVGIQPEFTREMRQNIIQDYNQNQNLNIKNWAPNQITRLRDMVERSVSLGYRRPDMIDMIATEWGVSQNKARFLARQETSLLMSKIRRERSLDAGVRRYRWSTSLDSRVRPADIYEKRSGADHRRLHGKVFEYGSPPVVNVKTGRRAEPGEDFNCRCVAIPVV